jgi:hypothetical protein
METTVVRALFPSSANLRHAARSLKSQRRRLLDILDGALRAVGPSDLSHAEKSAIRLVPAVLVVAGRRHGPGTTADARRSRSDRLAFVYTAPPLQPRYTTSTFQPASSRKYPKTLSHPLTPPPQRVSDARAELLHITRYSSNQVAIAAPSTRVKNGSKYLGSFGVGPVSSLCRTEARRIMRAFRPASA